MTARVDRRILGNKASAVSKGELIKIRIDREPVRALIGRTAEASQVPITIILTAQSRTDDEHPDPYGLGHIQGQPSNTVWWRLMTDGDDTYLAGHQM